MKTKHFKKVDTEKVGLKQFKNGSQLLLKNNSQLLLKTDSELLLKSDSLLLLKTSLQLLLKKCLTFITEVYLKKYFNQKTLTRS